MHPLDPSNLGVVACFQGVLEHAAACQMEVLALARQGGGRSYAATALTNLAGGTAAWGSGSGRIAGT